MKTALLLSGLMVSGTLGAEPPRTRLGFSVGLAQPLGDLKQDMNDNPGIALAFTVPMDNGRGMVFRPRLEAQFFSVSEREYYYADTGTWTRESLGFGSLALGGDVLWYPRGRSFRGWYLLGGAALQGWWESRTIYDTTGRWSWGHESTHSAQNRTGLGLAVGTGFQFNRRIALEFRLTDAPYTRHEGLRLGAAQPDWGADIVRRGTVLQVNAAFTF